MNPHHKFRETSSLPSGSSTPVMTKPKELINLDIYPLLKSNIINSDKNCKDSLSEHSFFCFNCMVSTCPKCTLNQHREHLLIQRMSCLEYDESFFKEIEQIIFESFDFEALKKEYSDYIKDCFDELEYSIAQVRKKKLEEINSIFTFLKKNVNELQDNFKSLKNKIIHYYQNFSEFFNINNNKNIDENNSAFLMNFELLNLCDNQNLKVLSMINTIKDNLSSYKDHINCITKHISNNELIKYFPQNEEDKFESKTQFDDYYWDVLTRINVYNENILKTKQNIALCYNKTGSTSYLEDLVSILDSKNKKGIQYIFNQNILANTNTSRTESESKRIIKPSTPKPKIKYSNSKKNLIKVRGNNNNAKLLTPNRKNESPSSTTKRSNRSHSSNKVKKSKLTNHDNKSDSLLHVDYNGITLDSELHQKYFAYSLVDIYNKYFSTQKEPRKSFDISQRLFNSHKQRQFNLKEIAKPIVNTQDIMIYDSLTHKSTKIKVPLNKSIHGYSVFPDGCRHLLIDNTYLYILGGIDTMGNALSNVLVFNIQTHELNSIDNMLSPHSYHSVEFLENYDCIIVLGGENTKECEIYDLFIKKWTMLPELNYPRANVCVYFEQTTSEVYAMFGMEDKVTKKKNFSDVIEVLELNDISSGWVQVDYYKSAMLELKECYLDVLPFTKDKLLIKGVKNMRTHDKMYALFDITKHEIVNVNEKIMEQLKLEENKIKKVI